MKGVLARSRPAQGALQAAGARRFSGAAIVPVRKQNNFVSGVTVSVAAVEEQASFQAQEPAAAPVAATDALVAEEIELQELDAAQEQLLKWMLTKSEEEQEADLDEMVDYDEFGDDEYADIYEEVEGMLEETDYEFKVGDKVMGTVIEVDEDGAYVEIGAKSTAFCPITECSFARLKTPLEALRPGMRREFMVVEDEEEYGQVIVSLAAMEATVFWQRIRQLQEEDITVHVTVESANKGGMLVKYGVYDGFVPVSQFGPSITVDNMESLVGSDLPVKFLEVDEESERLVFSNKRASSATTELQGFKVGDVVQGVVQSVKPYGAFVDLGGVTGLLHISQITHERIMSIDKIINEGDKIKVLILSQDRERGRVTLSTKKLEPTPGDMLRDPQMVFEKAEEMAQTFRTRVEQAQRQAQENQAGAAPDANQPYVF